MPKDVFLEKTLSMSVALWVSRLGKTRLEMRARYTDCVNVL